MKKKVENIRKQLPNPEQRIITFSRNFTLSLSNFCQNNCSYCFYNQRIPKEESKENKVLLEEDRIRDLIQIGQKYECKEALILSGENPDVFPEVAEELRKRGFQTYNDYVYQTCEEVMKHGILPHTNIGLLSFNEMKRLKGVNASMGLMLESTCKKLSKKGGVHEKSPGKAPKKRIEHLRNAGKIKIPFTTGLLLGIGESQKDRIKDVIIIRRIYDTYEHIQEVIFQNFESKQGISYVPSKDQIYDIKDMLKLIGIAKIIFKNKISIQIPPNLTKGYEKDFIELGISDFGGISPITDDYINPDKKWPQERYLEKICKNMDFKLQERLPIYDKYIEKSGFCPDKIKKIINKMKLNE